MQWKMGSKCLPQLAGLSIDLWKVVVIEMREEEKVHTRWRLSV
jgi:hypothetical protein